jgi:hypothetical protein
MILGVGAPPLPQRRVWIIRRGQDRLVSLGGAVLPGDRAGEPFADPRHPLEVVHGRCPVPGLEVSPGDLLERGLLQLSLTE